ncbi:MAG: hypothetical protein RL288_723 [Actinomycetota bacterium]
MKNLSNNRRNEERANNNCGLRVEISRKVDVAGLVKSLKLIKSGTSNSGSNSRAAARAFSGTNHSAFANSHSFNLIGMNSSAVVTAGGLSGKGMDLLAGGAVNNVHRVSGINLLNLVPTNFEAVQGVNNQNALIEENNFGMNEYQIENCAGENSPEQRAQGGAKAVINNVDVNQSADGKEGAKTHYITTAWSEGFGVAHLAILSRQERRAA